MSDAIRPRHTTDEDEAAFEADVRSGDYSGQVTVGRDLVTIEIPQQEYDV